MTVSPLARVQFLSRLAAAEVALQEGRFDVAASALPELESRLPHVEDDADLVNRFWIVHAVATDRPEEYCS